MKNVKKILAMMLALIMVFSLVACGRNKTPETTAPVADTTVNENPTETNPVENDTNVTTPATEPDVEINPDATEPSEDKEVVLTDTESFLTELVGYLPLQFGTMTMTVKLNDADALNYYTGLSSADGIVEAAFNEPMMSSQAYSVVLVKVAEGTDANTIADAMRSGINPNKWLCVEADSVDVYVYGQYALLVMLSNSFGKGLTTQSVIDTFTTMMELAEPAGEVNG
jgi:predicted small lipoprotein YifL